MKQRFLSGELRLAVINLAGGRQQSPSGYKERRGEECYFLHKKAPSEGTNFLSNFPASDSRLGFKFSGNSSRTDWCSGGGGGEEDQIIVRLEDWIIYQVRGNN